MLNASPSSLLVEKQMSSILESARNDFFAPAIVAGIAENGQVLWQEALGYADLENKRPAQLTDIYRIGSISKPFAAMLLLTLHDQGKIKLDQNIQAYLPYFLCDQEKAKISVKNLLNHTSGIRHYAYEKGEKENQIQFSTMKDGLALNGVHDEALLANPNDKFIYSSYGYNLIGALIEEVSQKPYGQFIAEQIFSKAGMKNSGLDEKQNFVDLRVSQYRRQGGSIVRAPEVNSSHKWSSGGLVSNAEDLLSFAHALYEGKIINQASLELAQTTTNINGVDTEYGLGWRVFSHNGRQYVSHGGSATGGSAYLLRAKNQDRAIVLLTNIEKANLKLDTQKIKALALKLFETYFN